MIKGKKMTEKASQYQIVEDGTVLDKINALQWMRCSFGKVWNGDHCTGGSKQLNWLDASYILQEFNENEGYAGHNDWRLPTLKELMTLTDASNLDPAINTFLFPDTESDWYWTKDEDKKDSEAAWMVNFYNGDLASYNKESQIKVRLVRDFKPEEMPTHQVSPSEVSSSTANTHTPQITNSSTQNYTAPSNHASLLKKFMDNLNTAKGYFGVATFLIALASGIIGFMFYVPELPRIEYTVDLTDNTSEGRQLNFVNDVARYAGRVVYFDLILEHNRAEVNRSIEIDEKYVLYYFNFGELYSEQSKKDQHDLFGEDFIKSLLAYYGIPRKKEYIRNMYSMLALDMSGYHAHIFINTDTDHRNEYSNYRVNVGEGTVDYLKGPFQIKEVPASEAIFFDITAPTVDSAMRKQIACTTKDWNWLTKMLFCQFL